MKYLIFFSLLLLSRLSCGQTKQTITQNDWIRMELTGKVKILKESCSSNSKQPDDKFTTIYSFNRNGYIEKISDKNSEILMAYDTIGNKVEEKELNKEAVEIKKIIFKDNLPRYMEGFDNQGQKTWKTELLYINNKVSKEITYDNDTIHSYFEYKYDNNGNKIEVKKFNSKNELKLKNTYKFDTNNHKVEFSIYDWKTNKIIETYKYFYDDENQIVVILLLDVNDKLLDQKKYDYEYKYDSAGNWTYSAKYINGIKQNDIIFREIEYY